MTLIRRGVWVLALMVTVLVALSRAGTKVLVEVSVLRTSRVLVELSTLKASWGFGEEVGSWPWVLALAVRGLEVLRGEGSSLSRAASASINSSWRPVIWSSISVNLGSSELETLSMVFLRRLSDARLALILFLTIFKLDRSSASSGVKLGFEGVWGLRG
eukprot:CAMPEP_0184300664 /NCGR_PEP_ID=MMETSP1049-20130417/11024_1 /TAXON_ID=77928 /ORGANISM="Proteomonas sulcata, Strain CCMP704" /LENGTH=158 /DNA_ID=CAMNT_0026611455 /DNA_START=576 /DNA_END=1052 /DNA_ORIENTATION=-